MKVYQLLIVGLSIVMLAACQKEGCTDQAANNYNSNAQNDDGSCTYDNQNPNNPNQTLPIHLTGTEGNARTIADISTDPNVIEYYIDGTWKINAAVTIEPGVRIEMRSGARIIVMANGSLNATATSGNKINIAGTQDVAGFWKNIEFESNNPSNKLIHCNISNGSNHYGNTPGMIVVLDNCQVTIQNSNLSKGSEFGVMTVGKLSKLPDFHSNNFSSFSKAPIRLASLSHTNYLDNTTNIAANNTIPYIYIYGYDVNSNTTVPKMNVPYSLRSNVNIFDSHTKVDAGVEMRMAADVRLIVTNNASLEFAGTSSEKCKVIGEASSKGFWKEVRIESNNPANKFSYTTFSGGRNHYGNEPGAIRLTNNALLNMDNCHIENSPSAAVGGATSSVFNNNSNNTWSDCDGGGGLLP